MNSELLRALKTDNIQSLEVLLKNNTDAVKQKDDNGNTPLLLAAANGRLSMLRHLVENSKVSLATKNNFGSTALLLAAANGHISVVQYLLENTDSKITEKNYYGDTALLLAAAYGHISMTRYLLENTEAKITEQNQNGSTPLLAAAAYGHILMVKYLLENTSSSISERSHSGHTVLLIAASYGHIELVKYLLDNTASTISERSNSGSTALLLAAYNGHIAMVDYLLNNTSSSVTECNQHGNTALLLAAYNGQIPMLEYLLSQSDVSVSEKNKSTGDNALCLAAWNGHVETVRFLLNRGIPIDLVRQDGRTTLEIIQGHSNTAALPILEAAEKLLKRCETLEISFKESLEELLAILSSGIHAKRRITENTALHSAILSNQIPLVKALLTQSAKLDSLNLKSETPLFLALQSENTYLKMIVCLAKIKELCHELDQFLKSTQSENIFLSFKKSSTTVLGISESKEESKEIKESQTSKESLYIKNLEYYLQIILEGLNESSLTYSLSVMEIVEITDALLPLLANPKGPFYRPHIAYELLSKINKPFLLSHHHAMMYDLLQSGHVYLQSYPDNHTLVPFLNEGPLLEGDSTEALLLKKKMEHLSQSDRNDKTSILNTLITEYIELPSFPNLNIQNENIESLFLLIDALKNQIAQNKQLQLDQIKQKREFQEQQKKLQLELEKAKNEIDKFKDLVLASQAKKIYDRELLLTQY